MVAREEEEEDDGHWRRRRRRTTGRTRREGWAGGGDDDRSDEGTRTRDGQRSGCGEWVKNRKIKHKIIHSHETSLEL